MYNIVDHSRILFLVYMPPYGSHAGGHTEITHESKWDQKYYTW
jgi:hypothetical protein